MAGLFRKISRDAARLQTLFHKHARRLSLTIENREWHLETPVIPGDIRGATIYGRLGDGEITVWLNTPGWLVAAGSVLELEAEDVLRLPEELQLAALECFASGIFTAIERGAGLPASLTGMKQGENQPPESACFFSLTNSGGLRLDGAWSGTADGTWQSAVERALSRLPVSLRKTHDDLPLTAVVDLGVWTVSATILNGLAFGDVVLSPAGSERTVTVGGKWRFAACLKKGVLSVDGKTMTDAMPAPGEENDFIPVDVEASPAKPGKLDGLTVELQARVGSLQITLGDLRALSAGQIVQFGTPVESPATLVVNGKAVARGELLDVGGRVGVRITDISE